MPHSENLVDELIEEALCGGYSQGRIQSDLQASKAVRQVCRDDSSRVPGAGHRREDKVSARGIRSGCYTRSMVRSTDLKSPGAPMLLWRPCKDAGAVQQRYRRANKNL
jgi:hypothetical protein